MVKEGGERGGFEILLRRRLGLNDQIPVFLNPEATLVEVKVCFQTAQKIFQKCLLLILMSPEHLYMC